MILFTQIEKRDFYNYEKVKINNNTFQTEQLWIRLLFKNINAQIGVLYTPPNHNINEFQFDVKESLKTLFKNNKKIPTFVLGDFNIDQNNTAGCSEFLDVFDDFGLQQIISENTRVTSISKTLIDLIFTNKKENTNSISVIDKYISDHCIISAANSVKVKKISPKYIKFRPIQA